MNRLIFMLAAWMSLVSVVSASLTPRKESSLLDKEVRRVSSPKLSVAALDQAVEREAESEFLVTDWTKILLDGKPCKYEEVPGRALIIKREVAEDKQTVRKIHFRTRK